jgi:hypothetical protein
VGTWRENCSKARQDTGASVPLLQSPDSVYAPGAPLVQAFLALPHERGRSRLHALEELTQQLAHFRGLLPG